MGLFDYVQCDYQLPDTPAEIQTAQFQTKSFDWPYMESYVIGSDGKLLHYETEETPKEERPYPDAPEGSFRSLAGIIRNKKEPVDFKLTGSVNFYTSHPITNEEFEFVALFDDGQLILVRRLQAAQ